MKRRGGGSSPGRSGAPLQKRSIPPAQQSGPVARRHRQLENTQAALDESRFAGLMRGAVALVR
jgi:hypothetical protein